jgi:hypothetical protein
VPKYGNKSSSTIPESKAGLRNMKIVSSLQIRIYPITQYAEWPMVYFEVHYAYIKWE